MYANRGTFRMPVSADGKTCQNTVQDRHIGWKKGISFANDAYARLRIPLMRTVLAQATGSHDWALEVQGCTRLHERRHATHDLTETGGGGGWASHTRNTGLRRHQNK